MRAMARIAHHTSPGAVRACAYSTSFSHAAIPRCRVALLYAGAMLEVSCASAGHSTWTQQHRVQVSIAEEVQTAAPPAAADSGGGDPDADRVYEMTGQTGSLCYMAPEVLLGCFYNQKARRAAAAVAVTRFDACSAVQLGAPKRLGLIRQEGSPADHRWRTCSDAGRCMPECCAL